MLTPRARSFRRLRGLGQDGSSGDFGGEAGPAVDPTTVYDPGSGDFGGEVGLPTTPGGGRSSSGGGTPINWTGIIQTAIQGAAKGVQLSQLTNLPPGSYYQQTPSTITASTAGSPYTAGYPAGGSAFNTAQLQNMMPIILMGGGLVVLMMMMGSRR